MIFVICLIVAIVFIVLSAIFERNNCDIASLISGIIACPAVVATIIMLIVLIITYVNCPRIEAKWQECYASLNTRIENHMYSYSDKSELIQEVQKWNEDLSAQEKAQKNIWVAIFNPESIEGLNKIDLEKIK